MRNFSRQGSGEGSATQGDERLGQPGQARPEGYLLWVHARTPDDASAAPAIAEELSRSRGEAFHTLITSEHPGDLVPAVAGRVIRQLAPVETKGSIARFLEHWRPDAGIILDLPDRPNLVRAAKDAGLPLFLAASQRGALAAQRRLTQSAASTLRHYQVCLAASAADAQVLTRNGGGKALVEVTGPLTDVAYAFPCNDTDRDDTAKVLKGRPVWLAADISLAEADAVEAAHRRAFRFAHRLLLVIMPGPGTDADALAARLDAAGWDIARASEGGEPEDGVQVLMADGDDAHGLWYRLAPITFVGGTLDREAAPSDPYAPATLGSAVLHGPETGVATPRFRRLGAEGASLELGDSEALGAAIQTLLAPDKTAELAQAGWKVTTDSAATVERLVTLINTALDEREGA